MQICILLNLLQFARKAVIQEYLSLSRHQWPVSIFKLLRVIVKLVSLLLCIINLAIFLYLCAIPTILQKGYSRRRRGKILKLTKKQVYYFNPSLLIG